MRPRISRFRVRRLRLVASRIVGTSVLAIGNTITIAVAIRSIRYTITVTISAIFALTISATLSRGVVSNAAG
jgi:hypothetical protein